MHQGLLLIPKASFVQAIQYQFCFTHFPLTKQGVGVLKGASIHIDPDLKRTEELASRETLESPNIFHDNRYWHQDKAYHGCEKAKYLVNRCPSLNVKINFFFFNVEIYIYSIFIDIIYLFS